MAGTGESSETALVSSEVAEGKGLSSLASEPSSYMLKLFHNQGVVTRADPKDPTFRTPAEPPAYTAAIRALNILEVSTIIAVHMLPRRPFLRIRNEDDEVRTHRDVAVFGRVCTALYMSAMRVLYQRVLWLPSLWWILVDKYSSLVSHYTDMVVSNPPLVLFILRLQYEDETYLTQPESVVAYKFRRFLFVTAQVRALKIDNNDFYPAVLQYVSSLLPKHRSTLLPGLRTASWIDDEYLLPTFLSAPSDDSDARALSPSPGDSESDGPPGTPNSLRPWLPFHKSTIRALNLQIHTFVSPIDRTANYELFLASIQHLRNQCRTLFPRLEELMFLICRHQYHKPSMLARSVLEEIATVVLESDALPLSANIAQPPSSLPFKKEHFLGGSFVEGVAINGYPSHAPVLNAAGETAEGTTPPDAYPIISAHLVTTITTLAMACTTNMTPLAFREKHLLRRILTPAVAFRGLEILILHLEKVSLRLSHGDLAFIGRSWKNLRTLDLRFNTIVTNEYLDVIQLNSVQFMTKPELADSLKRIHLPALDVRNFRNLMKYRQDSLTTLTSSILYFRDDEVQEVCISLLAAYPNLTTVTGPGSALQWDQFAQALASIREKRRVDRANRDRWVRIDAAAFASADQ